MKLQDSKLAHFLSMFILMPIGVVLVSAIYLCEQGEQKLLAYAEKRKAMGKH